MGFEFELLKGFFVFPILYMLILYLASPYKTITIKDGFKGIMLGFVSITLLHFIYLIFPPNSLHYWSAFTKYFYIVGIREETAKFIAFLLLIEYGIKNGDKKHPFAYMFYAGMVGLGFAIEENIVYFQKYGESVLWLRNFTSVFGHMFFGMFAGYWYGLGKLNTGDYGIRSTLGTYIKKFPKTKQAIYAAMGLLMASAYHGLWNFSLTTSRHADEAILIFMIFTGFTTCMFMARHLITGFKDKIRRSKEDDIIDKLDMQAKKEWLRGDGPQTD